MIAFHPTGPLLSFTAATSAPTSVQAVSLDSGEQQYMLTNTANSVDVVVGFGQSDTEAKSNAAAGTNVSKCVLVLARSQVVITAGVGSYFSGITGSSTAAVYVQSGYGI